MVVIFERYKSEYNFFMKRVAFLNNEIIPMI